MSTKTETKMDGGKCQRCGAYTFCEPLKLCNPCAQEVWPNLLDACEEMLLHCAFQNEKAWKAAAKARAAIAKARKEV